MGPLGPSTNISSPSHRHIYVNICPCVCISLFCLFVFLSSCSMWVHPSFGDTYITHAANAAARTLPEFRTCSPLCTSLEPGNRVEDWSYREIYTPWYLCTYAQIQTQATENALEKYQWIFIPCDDDDDYDDRRCTDVHIFLYTFVYSCAWVYIIDEFFTPLRSGFNVN